MGVINSIQNPPKLSPHSQNAQKSKERAEDGCHTDCPY